MPEDHAGLSAAISNDDVDVVQRTLKARPALLRVSLDGNGDSPLHAAAQHDARRVAELLVTMGADFYARDVNGQVALDLPPGQTMNDTRRWLREVNKARNEFLGAVHHQKLDRVRELLAEDPSFAAARDIGDGWTPVMTACHFGNTELLQMLIDAGAVLDGSDFNSGHDAVYVCAQKGQAQCLAMLIKAGVNVQQPWRVNYGSLPMQMNALHVAAWKGHGDVVALLLAAKVEPNTRAASYAMFSPLHFAATEGHAAIVQQLLAAGADTTARDGRRCITAMEMAEAGKHAAVVAALQGR